MSNVRTDPRARRVEPTPIKVRVELRAGLNDVGKQSRAYVQQIMGRNDAKTPAARTGIVYDWTVANPDKLGKTRADESGRFKVRYELGDGIYRIVQPNEDYKGWPSTTFVKIANGQVTRIDQNAARAAFGLAPIVIGGSKQTEYLADSEPGVVTL